MLSKVKKDHCGHNPKSDKSSFDDLFIGFQGIPVKNAQNGHEGT